MLIKVTETHIRRGKRTDCSKCPIALALREATGSKWHVGAWECCPADLPYREIPLPKRVQTFIYRFDNKKETKPFTFRLDLRSAGA